jgi:hypothetical protein
MKWITLNKKKPEKLTLFKNFVKNHSQIMKKKNKDGIDHVRYKTEIIEFLIISFIKIIDQQRSHDPDNLESRDFIFQQNNTPSYKNHWTLEYLAQ